MHCHLPKFDARRVNVVDACYTHYLLADGSGSASSSDRCSVPECIQLRICKDLQEGLVNAIILISLFLAIRANFDRFRSPSSCSSPSINKT
mmetsp:Transcript_9025/g.17627  ORF Transcript_9025/g.17627 Transcript_9025/m.17627 type:complete len:91 (+) Transcript_9025:618-890(+)